jgi:hypothetical protein
MLRKLSISDVKLSFDLPDTAASADVGSSGAPGAG